MVAMGTSLADRAWGRESAVYRVAGVVNVIGGWFLTAIIAFTAAGTVAYSIQWNPLMIVVFLVLVALLLIRTSILQKKKEQERQRIEYKERAELISINGVIEESSDHIASVVLRVGKLYRNVVEDLTNQDLNKLRKTEKNVTKLNNDIDGLKDGVFYFIKSLEEESVEASKFYIHTLGHLEDITQSIGFIAKASYRHVNNNHKSFKKSQLKELISINKDLNVLLKQVSDIFINRTFDRLHQLLIEKRELATNLSVAIQDQVQRIRKNETSPKNATLYFSILLETQDLVSALMNLLELYQEFHLTKQSVENKK